ncbi:patatin family protein, partial [Xenorhabdus bovienii]|nr:patatin family protein [Xenorhabdus bovienii]
QDYHLGRRCGRYFLATIGHTFVDGKFGHIERKSYGVCRSGLNSDSVNHSCFRRNHFLNHSNPLIVGAPASDVIDNTQATEQIMMDNLDNLDN